MQKKKKNRSGHHQQSGRMTKRKDIWKKETTRKERSKTKEEYVQIFKTLICSHRIGGRRGGEDKVKVFIGRSHITKREGGEFIERSRVRSNPARGPGRQKRSERSDEEL